MGKNELDRMNLDENRNCIGILNESFGSTPVFRGICKLFVSLQFLIEFIDCLSEFWIFSLDYYGI